MAISNDYVRTYNVTTISKTSVPVESNEVSTADVPTTTSNAPTTKSCVTYTAVIPTRTSSVVTQSNVCVYTDSNQTMTSSLTNDVTNSNSGNTNTVVCEARPIDDIPYDKIVKGCNGVTLYVKNDKYYYDSYCTREAKATDVPSRAIQYVPTTYAPNVTGIPEDTPTTMSPAQGPDSANAPNSGYLGSYHNPITYEQALASLEGSKGYYKDVAGDIIYYVNNGKGLTTRKMDSPNRDPEARLGTKSNPYSIQEAQSKIIPGQVACVLVNGTVQEVTTEYFGGPLVVKGSLSYESFYSASTSDCKNDQYSTKKRYFSGACDAIGVLAALNPKSSALVNLSTVLTGLSSSAALGKAIQNGTWADAYDLAMTLISFHPVGAVATAAMHALNELDNAIEDAYILKYGKSVGRKYFNYALQQRGYTRLR